MSTDATPVADVAVVLGFRTKSGKREEVVHTIDSDEVSIVSCTYAVERKIRQVKDEAGKSLGFEPTGEYVLTLKVKYTQDI